MLQKKLQDIRTTYQKFWPFLRSSFNEEVA